MLEDSSLAQADQARTQQLSEGVFWFFIATTILLALFDRYVENRTLSVVWAGLFVWYYLVRISLTRPQWRRVSHSESAAPPVWLRWRSPVSLTWLLDLLVITLLVALSGGWQSPLYLLYLGWAAALLNVASARVRLWFSGFACCAFALGVLLAPRQPFSALQMVVLTQEALLLALALLCINAIKAYMTHTQLAWEVERRQWAALRQAVFSQLSHELYTPLSAIKASAGLLAAVETPLAEQKAALLRVIDRNCARMNLLIDDLLALWREPERQFDYVPRCLPCLPIAESVGQMLSPLLELDRQWLVISAEPQDVAALADRQRLEQVLVNLLSNAQKFAPADTAITLTISDQGDEALFAVHDEGEGVPQEEQGRLFDVFYRGTNSPAASRGSGIGLALVKMLVALQGGRIWVESMPGNGCTFYFTLPSGASG